MFSSILFVVTFVNFFRISNANDIFTNSTVGEECIGLIDIARPLLDEICVRNMGYMGNGNCATVEANEFIGKFATAMTPFSIATTLYTIIALVALSQFATVFIPNSGVGNLMFITLQFTMCCQLICTGLSIATTVLAIGAFITQFDSCMVELWPSMKLLNWILIGGGFFNPLIFGNVVLIRLYTEIMANVNKVAIKTWKLNPEGCTKRYCYTYFSLWTHDFWAVFPICLTFLGWLLSCSFIFSIVAFPMVALVMVFETVVSVIFQQLWYVFDCTESEEKNKEEEGDSCCNPKKWWHNALWWMFDRRVILELGSSEERVRFLFYVNNMLVSFMLCSLIPHGMWISGLAYANAGQNINEELADIYRYAFNFKDFTFDFNQLSALAFSLQTIDPAKFHHYVMLLSQMDFSAAVPTEALEGSRGFETITTLMAFFRMITSKIFTGLSVLPWLTNCFVPKTVSFVYVAKDTWEKKLQKNDKKQKSTGGAELTTAENII